MQFGIFKDESNLNQVTYKMEDWYFMSKTTIQITRETRNELRELGKKGETYDTIIQKLILFYTEREE